MTSVTLALPMLGLILMQAAGHNKEPRQRPVTFALSQAAPEPQSPSVPGDKAFNKLFKEMPKSVKQQRAVAARTPERKIVCGMVVIPVDDSIDPKFVHRAPEDTSGLKIRVISPTSCAE